MGEFGTVICYFRSGGAICASL